MFIERLVHQFFNVDKSTVLVFQTKIGHLELFKLYLIYLLSVASMSIMNVAIRFQPL